MKVVLFGSDKKGVRTSSLLSFMCFFERSIQLEFRNTTCNCNREEREMYHYREERESKVVVNQ